MRRCRGTWARRAAAAGTATGSERGASCAGALPAPGVGRRACAPHVPRHDCVFSGRHVHECCPLLQAASLSTACLPECARTACGVGAICWPLCRPGPRGAARTLQATGLCAAALPRTVNSDFWNHWAAGHEPQDPGPAPPRLCRAACTPRLSCRARPSTRLCSLAKLQGVGGTGGCWDCLLPAHVHVG